MKKSAILLLPIAVLLLILVATGCDDSGQQSMSTSKTGSPNAYTIVTSKGQLHLNLVKEWSGTGNKKFYFDVSPGPFVVDWSSSKTSSLGASFEMNGGKVDVGDWHTVDFYTNVVGQRGYTIVHESGHFIVEIESSGCEWRVRVGTE